MSCDLVSVLISIGQAGGLSDHIVVDTGHVILLPDSIPLDIGGKISLPCFKFCLSCLGSDRTMVG